MVKYMRNIISDSDKHYEEVILYSYPEFVFYSLISMDNLRGYI